MGTCRHNAISVLTILLAVPISIFLIVLFLFLAFRDTNLGFVRLEKDVDDATTLDGDADAEPKAQRRFSRFSLVRRRSSGWSDV